MVRRTFQQVKARDPSYSGGFAVDEWSLATPTPDAPSPPPELSPAPEEASPDPSPEPDGRSAAPAAPPPTNAVRASNRAPRPSPAAPAKPARGAGAGRAYVPVRVRARADQVDRIVATGLRPGDVLKAAWRKASSGYAVAPTFVEPEPAGRAGGSLHFNTTLIVDADALAALASEHDPLGVRGGWWLLRGQLEPRLWEAIEDVLEQVATRQAR